MAATDVLLVGQLDSPHIRRLGSALADRRFRVTAIGFGSASMVGVDTRPIRPRLPRSARYIVGIVPVVHAILSLRPTVVHGHYVSSYGLLAALAVRFTGFLGVRPRLVQTAWGTDLLVTARTSRHRRLMAAYALQAAETITGDSLDLEREAAALAPDVPFHRFVFGPDRSLLEAARAPETIVVSARRLDHDTRVDLVIRGFRRARALYPHLADWRLIVAGTGSQALEIARVADNGDDVELVGQLEPDALKALLLRAAVVVSIPRSDATSAALLEALAAGAVPVVNELPANLEWVDTSIAEVVSPDPDETEVAEAIARATGRRVSRADMRARVADVEWAKQLDGLVSVLRPSEAIVR